MSNGKERFGKIKRIMLEGNGAALSSSFALEIFGNKSLTLVGCCGIAEYGLCRISLHVKDGLVIIDGRELLCDSYVNGGVRVSGRLDCVTFSLSGDGE